MRITQGDNIGCIYRKNNRHEKKYNYITRNLREIMMVAIIRRIYQTFVLLSSHKGDNNGIVNTINTNRIHFDRIVIETYSQILSNTNLQYIFYVMSEVSMTFKMFHLLKLPLWTLVRKLNVDWIPQKIIKQRSKYWH